MYLSPDIDQARNRRSMSLSKYDMLEILEPVTKMETLLYFTQLDISANGFIKYILYGRSDFCIFVTPFYKIRRTKTLCMYIFNQNS